MTTPKTTPKPAKLLGYIHCDAYTLTIRKPETEAERSIGLSTFTDSRTWVRVPHEAKARIEVEYPDGHTVRLAIVKAGRQSYAVAEESTGQRVLRGGFPTSLNGAFEALRLQLSSLTGNTDGAGLLRMAMDDLKANTAQP